MEILKIQPTEENPYIVDSYPYGFKRCICKFWIESVKGRGDRFVKQTQNPKTLVWNKPKKSTYTAVMIAILNENGHITYRSISMSADAGKYKALMEFIGDMELNDNQKERLKVMRAYIKAYEGVTFECVNMNGLSEEERKEYDEQQKKTQESINNRVKHEYIRDEGSL